MSAAGIFQFEFGGFRLWDVRGGGDESVNGDRHLRKKSADIRKNFTWVPVTRMGKEMR